MLETLAKERKKFLSVKNAYRIASYDLIRYRARPAIINPLPVEKIDETLPCGLDPDSKQSSFSESKPTPLENQSYHSYLIPGSIIVLLASVHAYAPIIARAILKEKGRKGICGPWYAQFIIISYVITGFVGFILFTYMIFRAFDCFRNLLIKLHQNLVSAYIDERYIEQSTANVEYLNIKQPHNLDYFLMKVKRIVGRAQTTRVRIHLFTVTFAFTTGTTLAIISIGQVLTGSDQSPQQGVLENPLSIVMLIDLVIMSLLVVAVLLVIAEINHASTTKLSLLLLRVHLEAVHDEELHIEDDDEDNENYRRTSVKAQNTLRYLETVIAHTKTAFEEYKIKLFGLVVVDRNLVIKVVLLLITNAAARLVR
ncbi:unnamed protein product [Didymodactylos carnosus]|uniref:Uncharacterized protein n=1 Tax=Didymodactylos carnosus TaxID=1234261 RepID=A0A814U3H7_9BILA|nr:unnamed protein product [Didymodactylos carnosus]CAF1445915.1 unnamed protein product [Didymodactylos carnosus]CAF3930210.1 unnamed protein product [Didymodactylos carnosus]CAF4241357.1 unnamed protein product [Didymodactylos carnosus]